MSGHLFTPDALQQIIQKMPLTVDPAKPHAMIGSVDANGVQVAVMMKFADTWTVQGVLEHTWTGDTTVGAKFIGVW
jgi:hypothetical protein